MLQLTFGFRILATKFGSLKDGIFAAAARLHRTPPFKSASLRMSAEDVDAGIINNLLISFVVSALFSKLLLHLLQIKSH